MNWEIGIDICTLICIKWITNKNLLYKNKQTNKNYRFWSASQRAEASIMVNKLPW